MSQRIKAIYGAVSDAMPVWYPVLMSLVLAVGLLLVKGLFFKVVGGVLLVATCGFALAVWVIVRPMDERQDEGQDVAATNSRDYSRFRDLYASERARYDDRRAGWEEGWEQPIWMAARLIGSGVDSLSDDGLLDAWACYVEGRDASDFPWYDVLRHLFEDRDETMSGKRSWSVQRWAWLYVVAERCPGFELKYRQAQGSRAL